VTADQRLKKYRALKEKGIFLTFFISVMNHPRINEWIPRIKIIFQTFSCQPDFFWLMAIPGSSNRLAFKRFRRFFSPRRFDPQQIFIGRIHATSLPDKVCVPTSHPQNDTGGKYIIEESLTPMEFI
jgi:hypothetical protein